VWETKAEGSQSDASLCYIENSRQPGFIARHSLKKEKRGRERVNEARKIRKKRKKNEQ
jgi:hypothetical protein